MHTEPKLEDRSEQPYVGIRTLTPVKDLSEVIPQLIDCASAWLGTQGIASVGVPFIRYYMLGDEFDIEIGFPVAAGVSGDDSVVANVLPAGRYATLVYTGVENGYPANKALVEWAEKNAITWDHWDVEKGDAFRSRYETFLSDDDPDMGKWETEVAIKLADARLSSL